MLQEESSDWEQSQETWVREEVASGSWSPGQVLRCWISAIWPCHSAEAEHTGWPSGTTEYCCLAWSAAPWSVLGLCAALGTLGCNQFGVMQLLNIKLWSNAFWAHVEVFVIYIGPHHLQPLQTNPGLWGLILLATILEFPKIACKMPPLGQGSPKKSL